MVSIVRAYSGTKINFSPQTALEEVLQNVNMIISTPKFTVPLDRNFGLSQRFIDMPLPAAQAVFIAEIIDAITEYEPRAEVVAVTFEQDKAVPGRLLPVVEVNMIDNSE